MGEYITVEQAAILLHVSPTTVRRWIYQGSLKAKKPRTGRNARVLIDKDDLEALLAPAGASAPSYPPPSRQAALCRAWDRRRGPPRSTAAGAGACISSLSMPAPRRNGNCQRSLKQNAPATCSATMQRHK